MRFWPRNPDEKHVKLDLWLKKIAPRIELHQQFGENPAPELWEEFQRLYGNELKDKHKSIKLLERKSEEGRLTLVHPLLKLLNAVRIPDLDRPSTEVRQQARQAITEVIDGLRKRENHVVWPSGRAQRDGVERLAGAEAATEVLRAVPQAEVVLVRTRGVWGSMFSYAFTGKPPPLIGSSNRIELVYQG